MGQQVWTIGDTLAWCREYLVHHDDENPKLSAEWLLAAATGLTRIELYMHFDRPLTMEERDVLRETLKRRGAGEPLQYISGEAAFRHIVVKTSRGVLIPRPETEVLVDVVLDGLADTDAPRVLEVGCGTGCIACSLAKEAGAQVLATDISPEAVACAQANVEMLGFEELVEVVECDCVAEIAGSFDCLVSNPPYIPTAELAELPHEVAGFEPRLALDGGPDGLAFFDRLITEALPLVKDGGLFACELHETCLDEAARRLREAGCVDVKVTKDLVGRDRIVSGVCRDLQ
ncbi:MAG: peptide chain release factor N(5)-glutamine methyltransferase [Coriobacteriia bacterium]|nr:MAG: peptide chain release factor N(5)-glutamine methyltransferase [Coriobacteriia bacterium]